MKALRKVIIGIVMLLPGMAWGFGGFGPGSGWNPPGGASDGQMSSSIGRGAQASSIGMGWQAGP